MNKKILCAVVVIAAAMGQATDAALIVNVESGSTPSILNLTVNGTVDFVGENSASSLIIFKKDIDWIFGGSGEFDSLSNVSVGAANTAPLIFDGGTMYLKEDRKNLLYSGRQDVIEIMPGSDFSIGDIVDYTFTVHGDGSIYNFTPLLGGGLTVQTGLSAIPEPSVMAFVSIFGAGLFGVRRFFMI